MIIYLHGFDSTSPGNHEKVLQLQFIDPDVRPINYSTIHPKHDLSHLLKEVQKQLSLCSDEHVLITGVGLGGFWSERVGFLCGIRSVLFNPNLHPEINMVGRIERPEEYADIATKCVSEFRTKNKGRSLVILSKQDSLLDNSQTETELSAYYEVVWNENETHKFKSISSHLPAVKQFMTQE